MHVEVQVKLQKCTTLKFWKHEKILYGVLPFCTIGGKKKNKTKIKQTNKRTPKAASHLWCRRPQRCSKQVWKIVRFRIIQIYLPVWSKMLILYFELLALLATVGVCYKRHLIHSFPDYLYQSFHLQKLYNESRRMNPVYFSKFSVLVKEKKSHLAMLLTFLSTFELRKI